MLPRSLPANDNQPPKDWGDAFSALCASLGAPEWAQDARIEVTGHEHEFGGPHRLTLAAGLALLSATRSMECLGISRGGPKQRLSLDLAHAARFLFPEMNSGLRLMGLPLALGSRADAPLLQAVLATRDGHHFVASALAPSQTQRWAQALGAAPEAASLSRAVALRSGDALEALALKHALPGALCRTPKAWRAHPQGQCLAAEPLTVRDGVASALHNPLPPLTHRLAGPMSNIRVLCFGRVFAGPIAARLLAEQGAEVLYIDPHANIGAQGVWMEGHVGGRAATVAWATAQGRETLRRLLSQSHVLIDNLRPNALEQLGLWPLAVDTPHPVRISISPFGRQGPWAHLPGYDMTAQAATGVMHTEGGEKTPALVPSTLAADFLAAALAAASAAQALAAKTDARPLHTSLSLARIWMWVQSLGQREALSPAACRLPPRIDVRTPWGSLRRPAPVVQCSHTPATVPALGVPAPNSHVARWQGGRTAPCGGLWPKV